ncbi:MAG TPA: ABC transporter permease [Candidatus Sulfotelmatobacter sp.]|jgi:hypothetical protein|nr:ABC transporter permease [Candidatus Sulfotelmatobacter sp.]
MGTIAQDLRYALRQLHKNPGFAAVAVLTLALGIGANTALFSVVNGVLLNPLPYPHPDQLVSLAEKLPPFPQFATYPNFRDWIRMNHTFQALAAYRQSDFNLTGSGEAQRVKATQVFASFFPPLGVTPLIGRSFSEDEDRRGAAPVVMLSASFWRRNFGASQDVPGQNGDARWRRIHRHRSCSRELLFLLRIDEFPPWRCLRSHRRCRVLQGGNSLIKRVLI